MTQHVLFHLQSRNFTTFDGLRTSGVVDITYFQVKSSPIVTPIVPLRTSSAVRVCSARHVDLRRARETWCGHRNSGFRWLSTDKREEGYKTLFIEREGYGRSTRTFGLGSAEEVEAFLSREEEKFPSDVFDATLRAYSCAPILPLVWFCRERLVSVD